MINTTIILNEEDKRILKDLQKENYFFYKDIAVTLENHEYAIGSIEVAPKKLLNTDYKYEGGYFEIKFLMGAHDENSPIKYSAKLIYTLIYDEILKVLLGEHILVNTIDGERIQITVE